MRVYLKMIGFPELTKHLGGKELVLEVEEGSLSRVIEELRRLHGSVVDRELLDRTGRLDQSIQVLLNDREWISTEQDPHPLKDGDRLTFLLMVAGG